MKTNTSIKERLVKGFSANVFGNLVTIVIQLAGVPIYLKYWGSIAYGDWLLLSAIPTYLMLSDIGLSSITANEMTMLVSQNNRKKALQIFQSTLSIISIISLFLISTVSAITWIFPLELVFNIATLNHQETASVLTLLTFNVVITIQTLLAMAVFQSEGDYAIGALYFNLIRLVSFILIIGCVSLGLKPHHCALVSLIGSSLGTILMIYDIQKRYKWLKYGYQYADSKIIKKLFKPAIAFMGFPVGDALSIQGIIIVVGIILGSSQVVIFSTLRTLSRMAWMLVDSVGKAVWPELSTAFSTSNQEMAKKLHRNACKASIYISLLIVILLGFEGDLIIKIWTNGKLIYPDILFKSLLILVTFNTIWKTSLIVPISINKHSQISYKYLTATIISIVSAIFLTKTLGLYGTVMALFLIDLIMIFSTIKISLALTNDNFKDFFSSLFFIR